MSPRSWTCRGRRIIATTRRCAAGHLDLRIAGSSGVLMPLTWECPDTRGSQRGELDVSRGWLSVVRCGKVWAGDVGLSRGRVLVLGTCRPTDNAEASVLNQWLRCISKSDAPSRPCRPIPVLCCRQIRPVITKTTVAIGCIASFAASCRRSIVSAVVCEPRASTTSPLMAR